MCFCYSLNMVKKEKKLKPVKNTCSFCQEEKEPDYKEFLLLKNFLSERGKIIGKAKTGICSKHQRRLGKAIKRARYLGLLPFIVKPR